MKLNLDFIKGDLPVPIDDVHEVFVSCDKISTYFELYHEGDSFPFLVFKMNSFNGLKGVVFTDG